MAEPLPPNADTVAAPLASAPIKGFVSIVVPALNEELTIGRFIAWCQEGLKSAGVNGEILIIDSSSDRTAEIAESGGARVLRVPKRGLGRAYIDALPHIRGQYIIMGDCDLTYDFREIRQFVAALEAGNEFVMGTRLKGYIEPGAMPPLHRYFGTPLTTWILNLMYGTHYSDIHCGMRAMTREALDRINLQSQSWEYASEMVLKAGQLRLKTAEVPIRFYKDPPGRFSHHKRSGWLSPWRAGWINLRAMFLYAPDFFLLKPGLVACLLGLLIVFGLSGGPFQVGLLGFSLHFLLLGVTLTTVGYMALCLGVVARVYHNFIPERTAKTLRRWTYDRGMILSGALAGAGLVLDFWLLFTWLSRGLRLAELSFPGIMGLMLIVLGFQTFAFTLILHMVAGTKQR